MPRDAQTVLAQISEIYDLRTVVGQMNVLKFHTPQDGVLQRHLSGLFANFAKWMYSEMEIRMVPASTLPLDPLQISTEAGLGTVDPKDMLNPILHRHYNGEHLQTDGLTNTQLRGTGGVNAVGNLFGQSITENTLALDTAGQRLYAESLMNPEWKKTHPQGMMQATARPLVRDVVANMQIGETAETEAISNLGVPDIGIGEEVSPGVRNITARINKNGEYPRLFTQGFKRLDWMDTKIRLRGGLEEPIRTTQLRVPKVYTYVVIMPPAFKQVMYYRVLVSHKIAFRSVESTAGIMGAWTAAIDPGTPSEPTTREENAEQPKEYSIETNAEIEKYAEGLV